LTYYVNNHLPKTFKDFHNLKALYLFIGKRMRKRT